MSILFELSLMFTKLAAFAFGGGYVIISSLILESEAKGWANASQLADIIALAGMTPGPVAMNIAVAYGYKIASFPGAFAALLGIALPCAIIVILAATFFFKVYQHKYVKGALYTLRATITGIIVYAAVDMAIKNGVFLSSSKNLINKGINVILANQHIFELKSFAIAIASFLILTKTKVHPLFVIIGSGVLGIIIFR